MSTEKGNKSARDFATLVALGILIAIGVAFWLFISSIMPAFLGIAILVGFFVFMGLFHYFVWGKWLMAAAEQERQKLEQQTLHKTETYRKETEL